MRDAMQVQDIQGLAQDILSIKQAVKADLRCESFFREGKRPSHPCKPAAIWKHVLPLQYSRWIAGIWERV